MCCKWQINKDPVTVIDMQLNTRYTERKREEQTRERANESDQTGHNAVKLQTRNIFSILLAVWLHIVPQQ